MFQFAFVALLFQFRARKPQLSPLLQLPNRRQTPPGDAVPIPLYFVFLYFTLLQSSGISWGSASRPQAPLYGYADRW